MAGSTENSLEAVEIVIVHIFDGIVVCLVGSWMKSLSINYIIVTAAL